MIHSAGGPGPPDTTTDGSSLVRSATDFKHRRDTQPRTGSTMRQRSTPGRPSGRVGNARCSTTRTGCNVGNKATSAESSDAASLTNPPFLPLT